MYCDWPQLGRCCFCMPLRRGVLTFGYIHIFFNAFLIGMYSYSVNYAEIAEWMIHGRTMTLPAELCVAFYCFELIFDGVLIYGAHKKVLMCLKVFFYYTITTCVALLIIQILTFSKADHRMIGGNPIEWCTLAFAGLCLQIYLLTLVWSLIKKLEISGPHVYDNQLHEFVSGEPKVDANGVYNTTTTVPTVVLY